MPTNVTADYKAAEAAYKRARDPQDRLDALKEMLRLIPKHKGTDHLQADIKSRIKELTAELAGPRKGGARSGPPTVIRPEGAAQIALLGPPNSGKSAMHGRLTGSHVASEPYPFATQYPHPGMFLYDEVSFQLIDLPSITADHHPPWIANALQPADAALLVADLAQPGCVEAVLEVVEVLEQRRIVLTPHWPVHGPDIETDDPFLHFVPTLLVASKADLLDDPTAELTVFRELSGLAFPAISDASEPPSPPDPIGRFLFEHLQVVRIYTRARGGAADGKPFTVRRGGTVHDVALMIHKDVAASLHYARLWNDQHQGQQVGRDHVLEDGDIIEIH
jgi:ribosome-interacting GTPase 1